MLPIPFCGQVRKGRALEVVRQDVEWRFPARPQKHIGDSTGRIPMVLIGGKSEGLVLARPFNG